MTESEPGGSIAVLDFEAIQGGAQAFMSRFLSADASFSMDSHLHSSDLGAASVQFVFEPGQYPAGGAQRVPEVNVHSQSTSHSAPNIPRSQLYALYEEAPTVEAFPSQFDPGRAPTNGVHETAGLLRVATAAAAAVKEGTTNTRGHGQTSNNQPMPFDSMLRRQPRFTWTDGKRVLQDKALLRTLGPRPARLDEVSPETKLFIEDASRSKRVLQTGDDKWTLAGTTAVPKQRPQVLCRYGLVKANAKVLARTTSFQELGPSGVETGPRLYHVDRETGMPEQAQLQVARVPTSKLPTTPPVMMEVAEQLLLGIVSPGYGLPGPRPAKFLEEPRGQLFFESPVIQRRRRQALGADLWRHSGGRKGATVYPAANIGPPRVRRQYGAIRKGHDHKQTVARFMAYSLVSSDDRANKCSRAMLFQVFPAGSRKPKAGSTPGKPKIPAVKAVPTTAGKSSGQSDPNRGIKRDRQ